MKRFLVLFAMVAFVGTMASAQSTKTCTKSKAACTKSKAATVSAELPACPTKAAAQLASMDENITAKTCAKSGKVSYYQKSVCATSGKVAVKEVKFCNSSKSFVNVAPSAKEGAVLKASAPAKTCTKSKAACTKSKASCSKAKAASCSKAKATTVSAELPACPTKAAAQLASMDENITAKTCAKSGQVSYYQKSVCATSGKVAMKEVKFCNSSKSFVNVAPSAKEGAVLKASAPATKKKSCAKTCTKSKSSCSKSKAKATQVKLEEK